MLFGATLWYGHFREKGLKGAEDWLRRVKGMGFDYVEFTPDYPLTRQLEPVRARQLNEMLESAGLKASIHVPWDIRLADPRPEINDGSMKIVEKCFELASSLGALYVNFHLALRWDELATMAFQEVRDDIMSNAVMTAGTIARMGDERSFPVTVENHPTAWIGKLSQLELVLEKNPGLKFCFDPALALYANWYLQNRGEPGTAEVQDWFRALGKRMYTIHLQDVLSSKGSGPYIHLAFGKGNMDMQDILSQAKRTACEHITLEVFYSDTKSTPITDSELRSSLDIARKAFS